MSVSAAGFADEVAWRRAFEEQLGETSADATELVELGKISHDDACRWRASQLGWPHELAPDVREIDVALAQELGFSNARRLGLLPIGYAAGDTVLWVRPDFGFEAFLEAQNTFGLRLKPVVVPQPEFNKLLQRAFARSGAAADVVQELDGSLDIETVSADLYESEDLLDSENDAPIIRMINAVLTQAIDEGASDIHIEPFEARVVIRYRVDGILRDIAEPPRAIAARVAARIKVMARLDIAEKRVPQDGRISLRLAGRAIDVRVSTVPTHYGERVVMRILEKEKGPLEFEQVGMPLDVAERFSSLVHAPHGIFLVTGPTGSGKTTTLYSALEQVRDANVNIITVEDPIEYDLPGACQIPVNTKTGMTFAKGLRAILRQDPDVIMVGEIRDVETADVAVQASLTGHRVFATLHTNDAVGSITRLSDIGVDSYLVASSLLGAMAQRLVRRLCAQCRTQHRPDAAERLLLGLAPRKRAVIHRPQGCEACGYTGYRGRTGLFELMVVDDDLRRLIHDADGERALRESAQTNGMRSLREDGMAKVLAGDTSLEEVLRVTHG